LDLKLERITDGETHRLLEGLWFNEIRKGRYNANELDENCHFVAKYPEKETEEFKDAIWKADVVHDYQVKVVFDVNGDCKLELL